MSWALGGLLIFLAGGVCVWAEVDGWLTKREYKRITGRDIDEPFRPPEET